MQFRFVHAATGTVLWMGKNTESVDPLLTRKDIARDLVATVGAELLQRGFLEVRQQEEDLIRGFNR